MTTYLQSTYDPLNTLGFDRIFDQLLAKPATKHTTYPPYNITKESETTYVVELALAGFSEEEIDITIKDSILTVEGTSEDSEEKEYLHRGIAARSFSRTFTLADTIVVTDATFKDGILGITLENVIPEEDKPRKIAINASVEEKQFLSE